MNNATPISLRILGRRWSITQPHYEELGVYGLCEYNEGRLSVALEQDPFETRDTLLHEAMHAVLYMQGRTGLATRTEELYVRALATGIVCVLQDNPEFAQWLIQPANQ